MYSHSSSAPSRHRPFLCLALRICLLAVLLLLERRADAALVTIQITGTVNRVNDGENLLKGAVALGDILTGFYVYDSAAIDSHPDEGVGDYRYLSAPYGVSLNVAGLNFRTNPEKVDFFIQLANDYSGRDNYLFRSRENLFPVSAAGLNPQNLISWQLDDPTSKALSSPNLSAAPPKLADWQSIYGLYIDSYGDRGGFLIGSVITSAVLVPEPSAVGLLSLGVATLVALRRKRSHPSR